MSVDLDTDEAIALEGLIVGPVGPETEYTVSRGVVLADPLEVGAARDFADSGVLRFLEHALNRVISDLSAREVCMGEVVFALRHTDHDDMSVLDVEAHVIEEIE